MRLVEYKRPIKGDRIIGVEISESDIVCLQFTSEEKECLKIADQIGRVSDRLFALYVIAKRIEIEALKRKSASATQEP